MRKQYPFIPSPNYGERRNGGLVTMLVLHYTVINFEQTKKLFLDPSGSVSAHYVIDTDGSIYQFVDESKRAWHAGVSCWDSITDVNSYSVGIEIVNPGYVAGEPVTPYPQVQLDALTALSQDLISRYNLKSCNVSGHSDVSPGRKIDPGPHFPWPAMAAQGIGLFPSSDLIEQQDPTSADPVALLGEMGYDSSDSYAKRAFQLHYTPKKWLNYQPFGDDEIKILMALLILKKTAR